MRGSEYREKEGERIETLGTFNRPFNHRLGLTKNLPHLRD